MAKNRRLKRHVDIYDDAGVAHSFGPDDDVPAWARSKITRKDLWATDDDTKPEPAAQADSGTEGDGDGSADGESGEPPRTGKGSGRDAWVAYAAQVDVEVTDDMSRDDIIEAIDSQ